MEFIKISLAKFLKLSLLALMNLHELSPVHHWCSVLPSRQRQDERCKEFWGSYASKQEEPDKAGRIMKPWHRSG